MHNNIQIIAEVKTTSPFGFKSDKSWEELFLVASKVGDIISIHTDKRWGGSYDLIKKARRLTDKPILAKGIHETDGEIKQAILAGADYVLVVGRIPKVHTDRCLIEPLTLDELREIPETLKVVWNSRDLSDGKQKKETFADARSIFKGWMCQASNIKTIEDIEEGADAVLVGTHLMEFSESLKSSI
jgi:indole-3-glycerol phosphate synthase